MYYHSHQNNSISHSHKIHVHQKLMALKPEYHSLNPSGFTSSANIHYFYQSSTMGHPSIFCLPCPKGFVQIIRDLFSFSCHICENNANVAFLCSMWQCMHVLTLKQVPKTVRVKLQINILNDRLVGGAFMFVCRFWLYLIKSKQGLGMRNATYCYNWK